MPKRTTPEPATEDPEMPLPRPTIRQLINAIQHGITDPEQVNQLILDPKAYAVNLNKWSFDEPTDPRIAKFQSIAVEGYELAHEEYLAAKAAGNGDEVAENRAKLMCAASSIVKWKRPKAVAMTDDGYLDQEAQIPA
jgi:hypothetical protein